MIRYANKNISRTDVLDLLRFPLAVIVVFAHVIDPANVAPMRSDVNLESMLSFQTFEHFVFAFLKQQSVPIYFFISGVVFFHKFSLSKDCILHKFRNRFKSLFLPFIIWNSIVLIIEFAKSIRGDIPFNLDPWSFLMNFWDASKGTFQDAAMDGYPINVPLWFLRDLMCIVLITPLIHLVLKGKNTGCIIIVALIVLWYSGFISKRLITGLCFFSIGAYISIHRIDMLKLCNRPLFWTIVYLSFAFAVFLSVEFLPKFDPTYIKRMAILSGVPFAYSFSYFLLKNGYCTVTPLLSQVSFFIYVSHGLFVSRIQRLLLFPFENITSMQLIIMSIISTAITCVMLLGIYQIGSKHPSKIFSILTGNRQIKRPNMKISVGRVISNIEK